MEKARARLARVRILGFHKDGLRPETSVRLYKSLIRPILEFMGSVIELPESQIIELEKFQNECLRSLLGLPVSTHGSLLGLLSLLIYTRRCRAGQFSLSNLTIH